VPAALRPCPGGRLPALRAWTNQQSHRDDLVSYYDQLTVGFAICRFQATQDLTLAERWVSKPIRITPDPRNDLPGVYTGQQQALNDDAPSVVYNKYSVSGKQLGLAELATETFWAKIVFTQFGSYPVI
jgi:hypothetical protein